MELWFFLWIFMVLLFCVSSRFWVASIIEPAQKLSAYRPVAQRVGRNYRIFAWGLVSLALLALIIESFWRHAQDFVRF